MARSTKYTNRKMSNALVKDITNKLMRHRFTPLLVAAWARDYALVTLVYEARYTLQHRLAMQEMEERYPGSFHKVTTFYCQVQQGLSLHVGSVTNNTCRVDGLSQYFLLNEGLIEKPPSFLVPSQHNERIRLNDIKPELDEAVFNFLNDHRALQSEITKAESEAYAAVRGFGTARMLVQGWPEIEPLVKDLLPRAGSNVAPAQMLPAVRIAEMNAAFHLPPEEALATPTEEEMARIIAEVHEVVTPNMLGVVNTVIGGPRA